METQESSPTTAEYRPRHHSSATTDSTSLTMLVFHLYSSSVTSSHQNSDKDHPPSSLSSPPTTSPASDELIAQLTIFITEQEYQIKLNSLKSLIHETFLSFLASSSAVTPPTAPSHNPSDEPSPPSPPHPPPHSPDSSSPQRSISIDIPRHSLRSWRELVRCDPSLSKNDTPLTLFLLLSNLHKLHQFFSSVKHCDSLMFVSGDHSQDLDLYSNWIHDDDDVMISELIHSVYKRTHREYDDTDTPLPPPQVLPFVLAHGYEMPAPNIRVLLQKTRTATDMYGKSYTIYTMVVIQGKLEWTIEHRYSGQHFLFSLPPPPHESIQDFARLHEALLSQPEDEMGFIPRHLLPILTKKKLKSRSLLSVTVDKRRIKLSRYINTLVSIEQALSNHYGASPSTLL